jgi:hypothetical protein
VSAVESIFFNLPNIHFLPCTPVTSKVRQPGAEMSHVRPQQNTARATASCQSERRAHQPCTAKHAPLSVTQFENDVYIATSEPHGNIEAVVTRKDAQPHSKL